MAKRPREACDQPARLDVAMPTGAANSDGAATTSDGDSSAPNPLLVIIQQLVALNQQQAQAMERQNASHAELIQQQGAQLQQQAQTMERQRVDHAAQLQQQGAHYAAQIDRLLSAPPGSANQPVPSVDAVMEGFRKANAVTDAQTGSTALHEFARAGHAAGIKALLAAGADPNAVDKEENTPLHIAAMHNHGEAVRILVAGGAYLEERNKENDTPLLFAVSCRGDNDKATQALIEAGVNVNVRALDDDDEDYCRPSALHIAAGSGLIGCVKALLAGHADVHATDEHGETPFHYACDRGVLPVIELLAEAGCTVESACTTFGSTPLLRAAMHGNVPVLSYLISKGANINAKYKVGGKTALLRAVERNKLECVRILLQAGADVTIADNNGLTPAKAAMEKEDSAEVLQLLLSGGGVAVKREEH